MDWSFPLLCFSFLIIIGIGVIAIYFVPKVISFLFIPKSGSMKPDSEEEQEKPTVEGRKSDKIRVKTDSPKASASGKSSREEANLFSKVNPFSGKKKCNDCGTELEYKEEYQSYYCPKCRTYKWRGRFSRGTKKGYSFEKTAFWIGWRGSLLTSSGLVFERFIRNFSYLLLSNIFKVS